LGGKTPKEGQKWIKINDHPEMVLEPDVKAPKALWNLARLVSRKYQQVLDPFELSRNYPATTYLEIAVIRKPDFDPGPWLRAGGECGWEGYWDRPASADSRATTTNVFARREEGRPPQGTGSILVFSRQGKDLIERAALTGHGGYVRCAFARDGQTLATLGDDGILQLWDLRQKVPRKRAVFKSPGGRILFSPDGKTVAVASRELNGTELSIQLWDLNGEQPAEKAILLVGSLPGVNVWKTPMSFSPDSKRLFAVSADGTVLTVWSIATGQQERTWRMPAEVKAVVFAIDSRHLAIGNRNGTVYLLRLPGPN
jgi:hypothetical protein